MFGRKKERPISFFFSAKDGALHLYPDRLEKKGGGSVETLPLSQLEGVRLEDGEELSSRVTMTRLVTLGVFALAAKKKTGGREVPDHREPRRLLDDRGPPKEHRRGAAIHRRHRAATTPALTSRPQTSGSPGVASARGPACRAQATGSR